MSIPTMRTASLRITPPASSSAETRQLDPTTPAAPRRPSRSPTQVPWPDKQIRWGATVEGRYRVEECLGAGGMATVYEAEDLATRCMVALKIPRPDLAGSTEIAARFEAEVQFSRAVRHPGLIRVFGAGRLLDGRPYLVLERLRGHALADELDVEHHLGLDRAFWIVREVARAMQAVHDSGIVHRDLKPSNIFIAREPHGSERVKVLDFGIAFAGVGGTRRLTTPGVALGTPAHMPPEQVRGQPANPRFDIYALGSVLFETVAGHPPFVHDDYRVLLRRKLEEPAPRLGAHRVVPPAIDDLVARCLDRDPSRRPVCAREIARGLDAWLNSPSDLQIREAA